MRGTSVWRPTPGAVPGKGPMPRLRGGPSGLGRGTPRSLDEVEILERLPRKRAKDWERLQHRWEWRYSGGERSPLDTEYWLLAVQTFGQGHGGLDRKPEHLPAELALLKFSLRHGVSHRHTQAVHHLPLGWLRDGEDWDYGVAHLHGVAPVVDPAPNDDIAQLTLASLHKLAKLLHKLKASGKMPDRLLVFSGEFLSVVGCLNHVCRLTAWESLASTRWEEELLCVEDFADTALRFFHPDKMGSLRLRVEGEVGGTFGSGASLLGALRSVVGSALREAGLWPELLCRLHRLLLSDDAEPAALPDYWERVYGRRGILGPHLKPRPEGYDCAEALARGAVALLRAWLCPDAPQTHLGKPLPGLDVLAQGPRRGPEMELTSLLPEGEGPSEERFAKVEPPPSVSPATLVYGLLNASDSQDPAPPALPSARGRGRGISLSMRSVALSMPGSGWVAPVGPPSVAGPGPAAPKRSARGMGRGKPSSSLAGPSTERRASFTFGRPTEAKPSLRILLPPQRKAPVEPKPPTPPPARTLLKPYTLASEVSLRPSPPPALPPADPVPRRAPPLPTTTKPISFLGPLKIPINKPPPSTLDPKKPFAKEPSAKPAQAQKPVSKAPVRIELTSGGPVHKEQTAKVASSGPMGRGKEEAGKVVEETAPLSQPVAFPGVRGPPRGASAESKGRSPAALFGSSVVAGFSLPRAAALEKALDAPRGLDDSSPDCLEVASSLADAPLHHSTPLDDTQPHEDTDVLEAPDVPEAPEAAEADGHRSVASSLGGRSVVLGMGRGRPLHSTIRASLSQASLRLPA